MFNKKNSRSKVESKKSSGKKPSSRATTDRGGQRPEEDPQNYQRGYEENNVYQPDEWDEAGPPDNTIPRRSEWGAELASGVNDLSLAQGDVWPDSYVHDQPEEPSPHGEIGDLHTGQHVQHFDDPSLSGRSRSMPVDEGYGEVDPADPYGSRYAAHLSGNDMHQERSPPIAHGSNPGYGDDAHHDYSYPQQDQSFGDGHSMPVEIEHKRRGKARGGDQYEEHHPSSLKTRHVSGDKHSRAAKTEVKGKGKAKARSGDADTFEHGNDPSYNTTENQAYLDPDDFDDPELEEAIRDSKKSYFGAGLEGETSALGVSTFGTTYAQGEEDEDGYDEEPDDTGPAHSAANKSSTGQSSKDTITGTPGDYEWIDGRFKIERSSEFRLGRVFKVLWAEPRGQSQSKPPETLKQHTQGPFTDIGKTEVKNAGLFFTGVRRFIIIGTETGSSTCVPILTYERKACTKKGVKPENHGIIYSPPRRPALLPKEPDLGFYPVAMDITIDGETLAKESRVNYSKLVTIEHNVKVLFIGNIYNDFFQIASDAVDVCWAAKTTRQHHKKHRNTRR